MAKKIILTTDAPQPIGPYSQAVRGGPYVFCSGQIPLDPQTGKMVGGEDVAAQTHQVMLNLKAVLTEAGLGFEDVVKTTIFIKSMDDFSKVNDVYAQYFKKNPPARATVEVSRLPKDAWVEIECIALGR